MDNGCPHMGSSLGFQWTRTKECEYKNIAKWWIGITSVSYAVDPGSNPDEGKECISMLSIRMIITKVPYF